MNSDGGQRRTDMMKRMYDLTKDESLCDLSIVVEDQTFKVHKFVMAAASKTLHDMISNDVKTGEDGKQVLLLDNVTPECMKLLIDYVYKGTVPELEDSLILEELRATCDVLDVPMPELQSKDDKSGPNQNKTPEIFVEVTTNSLPNSIYEQAANIHDGAMNIKAEPFSDAGFPDSRKNGSVEIDFENLENFKLEEIDPHNKSAVVIQIVEDESDVSLSDAEYMPESEDENDDFENDGSSAKRRRMSGPNMGKENHKSKKKGKIKENPIIVNGLDISSLFSTTKREPVKKSKRVSPHVPDPSMSLRRGRPRLPNDYLFPNEPPYICPDENCNKECDTREKLKKHYRSHGERKRSCGYCEKKFFYQKDLVVHMRIHTGERPYKCEVCDKGFAQKATLQYHSKMHDHVRMEYFCEICRNHYKTFKGLKTHIEKAHSDSEKKVFVPDLAILENPLSCPVCAVRFRNYQCLNHHIRRRHPDSEEAKGLPKGRQSKKPQATVTQRTRCEVVVVQQQSIEDSTQVIGDNGTDETIMDDTTEDNHTPSNDQETEFVCGYCNKSFNNRILWSEHIISAHDVSEPAFDQPAVASIDGIVDEGVEGTRILSLENLL